jgi:hypothetical protein
MTPIRLAVTGLAVHVCSVQNNVAADTLLYFCKRLWGLPYLAPTFALLLHRCTYHTPAAAAPVPAHAAGCIATTSEMRACLPAAWQHSIGRRCKWNCILNMLNAATKALCMHRWQHTIQVLLHVEFDDVHHGAAQVAAVAARGWWHRAAPEARQRAHVW